MEQLNQGLYSNGLNAMQRCYRLIAPVVYQTYGDTPDPRVLQRLWEEWSAIDRVYAFPDIVFLYDTICWLKEGGCSYCMGGCSGSSFVLYLLRISSGNPLPTANDIPWQPLWGLGERMATSMIVHVPVSIQNELIQYLQDRNTPHLVHPDSVPGQTELDVSNVSFRFDLESRNAPNNCFHYSDNPAPDHVIYREDVYSHFLSLGFSEKDAWTEMELVRKGRGLSIAAMEQCPDWMVEQYKSISYLPSKAAAVEWAFYKQSV